MPPDEVERFIEENRLNERAAEALRALAKYPSSLRNVANPGGFFNVNSNVAPSQVHKLLALLLDTRRHSPRGADGGKSNFGSCSSSSQDKFDFIEPIP